MAVGRVTLLALFVLLLCAGQCAAVDMEVTLGFDGAAKNAYWTPIAIMLHNKSANEVVGTLSAVQQDFGTKDLPTYTAKVELPPHSRKLYHLYVRLAEYGGDVNVALADGSKIIASRKAPANTCSPKDALIVSVGPRTSRPNYLMGDSVKMTTAGSMGVGRARYYKRDATITVGSIDQSRLPDRPAALEGVDCLILSDFRPSAVEPNALSAINSWVASGGTLIISTGPNYRRYANKFYAELLPVTVKGATNAAGLDSLSPFGRASFPAAPVAICQAKLKPSVGQTIVSQNGIPIVASRNYGAGKVVFLAVDHLASPFKDWSGQAAFWKSLIGEKQPGPIAYTQGPVEEQPRSPYGRNAPSTTHPMAEIVAQNPSMKTPSYTLLTLFLAAYLLVLAPLNYFVLRRKRRLELAWVTTPAIVLVFSVGAYAIGWTIKGGGLKFCEVTIVETSSEARHARAVTVASLFSPAKWKYDVEIHDPSAVCQVLADEDGGKGKTVSGEVSVIEELPINMWSSKSFQSVGGLDLGGRISSRLITDGRGVSGSIRNDTKIPLEKCCLVYGGNKVDLRDLPCGGSVDAKATFLRSQIASDYAGEHPSLARKLREQAVVKASGLGVPVLVGIARAERNVFGLTGESPDIEAATVCVFRLNCAAGKTFSFGPDQIIGSSDQESDYYDEEEEQSGAYLQPGQSSAFTYRIPLPDGGKITTLSIEPSSTSGITSTIYNRQTRKWDPLGKGAVANPSQYVDASGTFRIRAKCSGKRGQYVEYSASASGVRR